ncbi:hypothetical protein COT47_07625 [Candidatus Woesearchaeota archaeon CG08_land_8_20_14_0_20_43_7]|nr:MAG: hypothetical protein COT47_07625 [Candidatus Woesearchaeota archaeon CG08_land_8_20_14_0_20_43_7]
MDDIKTHGIVLSTRSKIARVMVDCGKDCMGCKGMHSCDRNKRSYIITAMNRIDAKKKEIVTIAIDKLDYYISLIAIFVIPMMMLFLGYYLTISFGMRRYAILVSISMLFLSFLMLFIFKKIWKDHPRMMIIKIMPQ